MRTAALLLALCGCSELPILPRPAETERLSERGFFSGPLAELAPAEGVFPYQVSAQLWADFAAKERFLSPAGPIEADFGSTDADWELPVGSVAIKNFTFPFDQRDPAGARRIVETRLLVRDETGWTGQVYLWNEEQTEAFRFVGGTRTTVSYLDEDGAQQSHEYVVPNTNECGSCHARDDRLQLLGVITGQMNREVERDGASVDQLEWLAQQDLFSAPPPDPATLPKLADPFGDEPLDARARAWLHANCAHCHRPGGGGASSGLSLLASETEPVKLGVCKFPAAAGSGTGGNGFDIVPGAPAESIMPFRIASTDPEIKMPEIPNRIPDAAGLELIEAWIASLPPDDCQ